MEHEIKLYERMRRRKRSAKHVIYTSPLEYKPKSREIKYKVENRVLQ